MKTHNSVLTRGVPDERSTASVTQPAETEEGDMNCCDQKPPADARRLLIIGVIIGLLALALLVLSVSRRSGRVSHRHVTTGVDAPNIQQPEVVRTPASWWAEPAR